MVPIALWLGRLRTCSLLTHPRLIVVFSVGSVSDWIRPFIVHLDSSFCINCSVGFGFLDVCSLDATTHTNYSTMDSFSSNSSTLELELQCWNILRVYAATDITIGEVELQFSDVFKNSGYNYDDARWRPKIGRIMGTESDDLEAIKANLKWIDDAISNLSTALFTSAGPATKSPQPAAIDIVNPAVIDIDMESVPVSVPSSSSVSTKPAKVRTSLKDYTARKRLERATEMKVAPDPVQAAIPSSQNLVSELLPSQDEEAGILRK